MTLYFLLMENVRGIFGVLMIGYGVILTKINRYCFMAGRKPRHELQTFTEYDKIHLQHQFTAP